MVGIHKPFRQELRCPIQSPGPIHRESRRRPGRFGVLLWLGLAVTALDLAGCASQVDTRLPDLSSKNTPPNGQKPLTPAEQKRVIDEMIAKRDGKATETK